QQFSAWKIGEYLCTVPVPRQRLEALFDTWPHLTALPLSREAWAQLCLNVTPPFDTEDPIYVLRLALDGHTTRRHKCSKKTALIASIAEAFLCYDHDVDEIEATDISDGPTQS